MYSNGMYDEERFDMNLADEGKAYNQGFEDGVKSVLSDIKGLLEFYEDKRTKVTLYKQLCDKYGVNNG